MKTIIFHIPWELRQEKTAATAIRPRKMLEAFESAGFTVLTILGSPQERAEQFKAIKARIKAGLEISFVYSESSTAPTAFADPVKKSGFLFNKDISYLKYFAKINIPIGVYLRDLYWIFPEIFKGHPFIKRNILKHFHRLDLKFYRKYVDVLFVQSEDMKAYVPGGHPNVQLLPPGLNDVNHDFSLRQESRFHAFYVGGITDMYDLDLLMHSLCQAKVEATFCVRPAEWQKKRGDLGDVQESPLISIVHAGADELSPYLEKANIGLCLFKPGQTRGFMLPVKVFEYLEYDLPILANRNTPAGRFVEENEIGWAIEYSEESIHQWITMMKKDFEKNLLAKRANIQKIKGEHLWIHRAKQAALSLFRS